VAAAAAGPIDSAVSRLASGLGMMGFGGAADGGNLGGSLGGSLGRGGGGGMGGGGMGGGTDVGAMRIQQLQAEVQRMDRELQVVPRVRT